jgi:hypothetical protein
MKHSPFIRGNSCQSVRRVFTCFGFLLRVALPLFGGLLGASACTAAEPDDVPETSGLSKGAVGYLWISTDDASANGDDSTLKPTSIALEPRAFGIPDAWKCPLLGAGVTVVFVAGSAVTAPVSGGTSLALGASATTILWAAIAGLGANVVCESGVLLTRVLVELDKDKYALRFGAANVGALKTAVKRAVYGAAAWMYNRLDCRKPPRLPEHDEACVPEHDRGKCWGLGFNDELGNCSCETGWSLTDMNGSRWRCLSGQKIDYPRSRYP